MLGNLLDNAIEGVQRLPKGNWKISLRITRIHDMLCITCINDANKKSIRRSGNTYLSSKRQWKAGYGMESIRRTVEQASGIFTFDLSGNTATAEVTMPF